MMGDPSYVLERIPAGARVLDVGGGAVPLARADVVLDVVERPTGPMRCVEGTQRNFEPWQWISIDANSKEPWPIADKAFDFVFCSHVLEDIRDPLRVCGEIVRVGKAGFIQTPSRANESTFGLQGTLFPGHMHHRWYFEDEGGVLTVTFKSPLLSDLPELACHARGYGLEQAMNFWWREDFHFVERPTLHRWQIVEDLVRFRAANDGLSQDWVSRQIAKYTPPFPTKLAPRVGTAIWRRVVTGAREMRRLV